MKNKTVKWYHFLFSWLLTLGLSSLIGGLFLGSLVLVSSFYAFIASTPFIVVFCIIMNQIARKSPSVTRMHLLTLLWHVLGAISVLVGLYVFKNKETLQMGTGLIGLMAIYFAIDSFFFHMFIWRKHRPDKDIENPMADELLDIN